MPAELPAVETIAALPVTLDGEELTAADLDALAAAVRRSPAVRAIWTGQRTFHDRSTRHFHLAKALARAGCRDADTLHRVLAACDRRQGADLTKIMRADYVRRTIGAALAAGSTPMNVVDEVVDDAVEAAAEATRGAVPTDDDAVAERVLEAAAMPRADYERARKSIASKLDIRVSVLDGLVKAARQASGEEQARTSQRDEIVRIARKQGDLWRDDSEAAFATVKVNGHREHYRVKSTAYRRLLVRAYGDQNTVDGAPTAPGSQALTEALTTIDAIAARGPLDFPKLRIGGSVRGPVYLDLGGDSWNAVEVTSTGWSVVPDPPVPFIRAPGMLPLPEPKRGRGGEKLKNHLGLDGANYRLVVGWLLGTLMPRGPYPILAVHGEEGSGKSTLTQMCRRLIDPNRAAERARPKDEHDLVIAASNAWLVCFGNLSSVDDKLSDAMCRISTGSGFATRTLYTNDDETIFQACRPQMVNGIPDLARSGDLVDRCVTILLPSRDEALRSYEDDLWHEFEADLPEMLGFLLDCVSCALSRLPDVKLSRRPRLVDFARWVEAAAPTLGWKPGDFLADYVKNRETSARTVVEGDAAGARAPARSRLRTEERVQRHVYRAARSAQRSRHRRGKALQALAEQSNRDGHSPTPDRSCAAQAWRGRRS